MPVVEENPLPNCPVSGVPMITRKSKIGARLLALYLLLARVHASKLAPHTS